MTEINKAEALRLAACHLEDEAPRDSIERRTAKYLRAEADRLERLADIDNDLKEATAHARRAYYSDLDVSHEESWINATRAVRDYYVGKPRTDQRDWTITGGFETGQRVRVGNGEVWVLTSRPVEPWVSDDGSAMNWIGLLNFRSYITILWAGATPAPTDSSRNNA